MLRICFCLALIVIIGNIRFSNATNCTSTTYNQVLDPVQLTASQINASDYANATANQIAARLQELYNETIVNMTCTTTKTTSSVSVAYNIIYGCNETITTVLPNGTAQTVPVNTNLNKTKVDQTISCGSFLFLKI
jgi:hypothetical protein